MKDLNTLGNELRNLEEEKQYIKNQMFYIIKMNNKKYNTGILKKIKSKIELIKLKNQLNKIREEIQEKNDEIISLELEREKRIR